MRHRALRENQLAQMAVAGNLLRMLSASTRNHALYRFAAACALVVIALLPRGSAGGPDPVEPLAPLVPQAGTRHLTIAFRYEKTVRKEYETRSQHPSGVGSNKFSSTLRVVVEGRVQAEAPDLNYFDARTKTVKTPVGEQTVKETDVYGLRLQYGEDETPARDEPRMTHYLRRAMVTGESDNYHFGINVWGKPDPRWVHRPLLKTTGSNSQQSNSSAPAAADSHDRWGIHFSPWDLEKSFTWSFGGNLPVTEDYLWESPWPPRRGERGTYRETRQREEAVDFNFPPADYKRDWTRTVQRTKNGLTAVASRSKRVEKPPQEGVVRNCEEETEKATLRIDFDVGDYELVITPPKGLDDWLPKGGKSEDQVGARLVFKGEIRRKNGQAAAKDREVEVNVELTSSCEPGVCVNWPAKGSRGADLRLQDSPRFVIGRPAGDGDRRTSTATGVFTPGEKFALTVGCYDYGAYGDIFFAAPIPVRIEGQSGEDAISIPKDANHNHIADAWEVGKAGGGDATSDDDDLPQGTEVKGDGLSLYEEYRGFRCKGVHARTDPAREDLFVFDPSKLGTGLFAASGIIVHLIDKNEFNEEDGENNRNVINCNRNSDTLGAQHLLQLKKKRMEAYRGLAVGGPGPPKAISEVDIDVAGGGGAPDVLAHELAHGCNVWHHGDKYEREPVEAENRDEDGSWLPSTTKRMVSVKGGLVSGAVGCIMRYDVDVYYRKAAGWGTEYRWRTQPAGAWIEGGFMRGGDARTFFCTDKKGTEVNATDNPGGPVAGDATRGDCLHCFQVNDIKPVPEGKKGFPSR